MEPTSRNFFRTIDKVGGPIEPTVGFDEIYTEIFIKKKTKITPAKEEVTDNKESEDEAMQTDNAKEQQADSAALKAEDFPAESAEMVDDEDKKLDADADGEDQQINVEVDVE